MKKREIDYILHIEKKICIIKIVLSYNNKIKQDRLINVSGMTLIRVKSLSTRKVLISSDLCERQINFMSQLILGARVATWPPSVPLLSRPLSSSFSRLVCSRPVDRGVIQAQVY